jgi:hypothetical protein
MSDDLPSISIFEQIHLLAARDDHPNQVYWTKAEILDQV